MSLVDEVRKVAKSAQNGDRSIDDVLGELDKAKEEINAQIDALEDIGDIDKDYDEDDYEDEEFTP